MDSMDYLTAIRNYNTRPAAPKPSRCALLVIDMQEYFRNIASPILDNVLKLIKTCRNVGMNVYFTRHGVKDPEGKGGILVEWWNHYIPYGDAEWELMKEMRPFAESIIDKNRYSAFYKTGLEEELKSKGIDEVIITGVMTNCCCETTARDAFMRDFRVFFVADANATVNVDLHICTLKTLAYGFAHVAGAEEIVKSL